MQVMDARWQRWAEIEARNLEMYAFVPTNGGGFREFGYYVARHVRQDELADSDNNMGTGLLPLLESKNDVAVFAWFERKFGDAVTEQVDAIDDGKEFLHGVYKAYAAGELGKQK